jgi:hypothetical protein
MIKICKNCQIIETKRRFTRGYCQNCYVWLRNNGLLENIPIIPLPDTLTKEQEEIFIGSMLGDGSICLAKKGINANFIVKRKSEDRDYLLWEYEQFQQFCRRGPVDEKRFDKRTNKYYYGTYFYTRVSPVFTELHKLWYPNGIKCVPQNIKLTPLTMLIWFLDDGWVNIKKTGSIQLGLATDGFLKTEVEYLAKLLYERYEEYYGVHDNGNKNPAGRGWIIQTNGRGAMAIIKDIDPIYPNNMLRKAKWRGATINARKSKKLEPAININNLCEILKTYSITDTITTKNVAPKLFPNTLTTKKEHRYAQNNIMKYLTNLVKQGFLNKIDNGLYYEKEFYITELGKNYFQSKYNTQNEQNT